MNNLKKYSFLFLFFLANLIFAATSPSPFLGHFGPISTNGGTSFRVWAPNANTVTLAGDFNSWDTGNTPLAPDNLSSNYWSVFISNISYNSEYKFVIDGDYYRPDPWSRQLGANDNSILKNTEFSWSSFTRSADSETVLYELHVGTFSGGTFDKIAEKAEYFQQLGINAVELMPPAQFGTATSWGYNPVGIYALENSYGGYDEFKKMVNSLHNFGIAVYIDVVYNHIEGNVLWTWDKWSEGDHKCTIDDETAQHGGIFYYSWKGSPAERWYTPWGKNRPDYSRPEVTNYLSQNVLFWLSEMNCDGIRMDSVVNMRTVNDGNDGIITETQPFLFALNSEMDSLQPDAIIIAEDLHRDNDITKKSSGGFGFDAQWNDYFVDNIREEMKKTSDADRDMDVLKNCVQSYENGRKFSTVKYSESHDDVANGSKRLNCEIDGNLSGDSYYAKKRSTLAAGITLTSLGIPMLFQGQEFLEDGFFADNDPLDWSKLSTFGGIFRLYRDIIHLRRNSSGASAGLAGDNVNVFFLNNTDKLMAYHRYKLGGVGDDVIVIVNNSATAKLNVSIGLPRTGDWYCLMNSDWKSYDKSFSNIGGQNVSAQNGGMNGLSYHGDFDFPPYSFVVYSQQQAPAPTCDFSASPTNGRNGLKVNFLDNSSGIITNWHWNFGDGNESFEINPVHTYYDGGIFSVSLNVSGPQGTSSKIYSNIVTVIEGNWVDGQNITADFADAENSSFQNTVTDWAAWNSLLSMRGTLTPDRLLLGIAGSIEPQSGNGLVIFIDTDSSTGENFLPPTLDNVAWRIKNMVGMVFDTEFTPDYAINISLKDGSSTPSTAWVDFSKLTENSKDYWGEISNLGTSYGYLSNNFVQLALYNQSAAGDSLSVTGTFSTGFELSLKLSEIGGTTDMCWVQAMVISSSGEYSANQSLKAIHNDTNSYAVGGLSSSKRYNLVPGEQFMVLGVPEPRFTFLLSWILFFWNTVIKAR